MPKAERYVILSGDKLLRMVLEELIADLIICAALCEMWTPINLETLGEIVLKGNRLLTGMAGHIEAALDEPAPVQEAV